MYIPPSFVQKDVARLHRFIEQNSFGLLLTQNQGETEASHLPFLLEPGGEYGVLIGHLARANPQWRQAQTEQAEAGRALAIFSGPHAYISPTWYEAPKTVPTWNYTAVHASGPIEWIHDPAALLPLLEQTVRQYETGMPRPWSIGEVDSFIEQMLAHIVGFRIEITSLEGKWKLNQNQPIERRKKVIRALREQQDENSQAVASLMQDTLPAED